MSVVNITNVNILEPKSHFQQPYKFEITFECLSQLEDDLEFKLVYVGSAENTTLDQELDSLLVGPVPVGVNKFVFEADAPQVDKIPKEDLVGVTVILLTCSYKEKEFVRIGYYVDNAYADEELAANPPDVPVLDKIYRSILADKPRVTRFPINWDDPAKEEQPPVQPSEQEEGSKDAQGDEELPEDEIDEDEDLEEDEDDEKGEVDLDMLEEQDEAEIMDEDDEDEEAAEGEEEAADEEMAGDEQAGNGFAEISNGAVSGAVPMETE
ncbi:histone deposition protein Asf1 [Martensiomyces pterosporus]|nr:histone deposition protein Asf1 [Martensiomyces pterosporus]